MQLRQLLSSYANEAAIDMQMSRRSDGWRNTHSRSVPSHSSQIQVKSNELSIH